MMIRRAGAVLAVLLLNGCSQIAVLAPVASRVTSVRAAAFDILVDSKVDMMTAPVCTVTGNDIDCVGASFDTRSIAVRSHADDPSQLTVTVAGTVLYEGSVQDVLDEHGR